MDAATMTTTTPAANNVRMLPTDGEAVCGFTPYSVGLMLASALLFTVVYNASSFVFTRLSSTYRQLPPKLQLRWDNRVASTLHALIIVPGCLHAFFFAFDTQKLTPHSAILGCNSGSSHLPFKSRSVGQFLPQMMMMMIIDVSHYISLLRFVWEQCIRAQ